MIKAIGLSAAVASLGWAGTLPAQIALTPKEVTVELDGAQIREQAMPDGKTRIHFNLPEGWRVASSSATQMKLASEDGRDEIEVNVINGQVPTTFDELRKIIAARPLPAEATIEEGAGNFEPGPVLAQAQSWENVTHYLFGGRQRIRSILIFPLKTSQLRFFIDQPAAEFEGNHHQLMAMLYSWTWEDAAHVRPGAISGDPKVEAPPESSATPAP